MNDPLPTLLTAAILAAQARSEDMKKAAEDAAKAYAAGWAAYGVAKTVVTGMTAAEVLKIHEDRIAARTATPEQKAAEHSGVCGNTGPAETCNCRNAMTA